MGTDACVMGDGDVRSGVEGESGAHTTGDAAAHTAAGRSPVATQAAPVRSPPAAPHQLPGTLLAQRVPSACPKGASRRTGGVHLRCVWRGAASTVPTASVLQAACALFDRNLERGPSPRTSTVCGFPVALPAPSRERLTQW